MHLDRATLDDNYKLLVEEIKNDRTHEGTIYKNANRYKHDDIVFIPTLNSIKEIIEQTPLPKRFRKIEGTTIYKKLKDYILTVNLLQQYFAPHSLDKSLIALDNRYLEKALGSRYRNNNNEYFKLFFNREIKGIKGQYTSGYSLLEKGEKLLDNYEFVTHKDNLDKFICQFIAGNFEINKKEIILKEKVIPTINNSYIEIPEENIVNVSRFNNIHSRKIVNNYIDGKLYYNKDIKDYGRTYSFLHSIPREIRNELFKGFTEIDIDSAAQSILMRSFQRYSKEELPFLNHYVNNKNETREILSKDLGLNEKEVKRLLQVLTFSNGIPKESQLLFKPSYKGLEKAINNDFVIGFSEDLKKCDEVLKENLEQFQIDLLMKRNKSLKNIDVRCFIFQSIESKLMNGIQRIIKKNTFHLHDAVYVQDISEETKKEIYDYTQKYQIYTKYTILDTKQYTNPSEKFIEEIENVKSNMKIFSLRTSNIDFKKSIQTLINMTEHIITGTKDLSLRIEIIKKGITSKEDLPKCNLEECNNRVYKFDKNNYCSKKCSCAANSRNISHEGRMKSAKSRDYKEVALKRKSTMTSDVIDGKNAHQRSSEKASKNIDYKEVSRKATIKNKKSGLYKKLSILSSERMLKEDEEGNTQATKQWNFIYAYVDDEYFKNRNRKIRDTMESKGLWIKEEDISDWKLYSKKVRRLTEKVYKENKDTIDPDNKREHLKYDLDHIISVKKSFDNNVPIHIVASLNNLQIIGSIENRIKGCI